MTQTIQIEPSMTMEQILKVAPSAQRALFQRYHIGGCSSCGFQPTDTLAQVCKDHNILDVPEVIRTIQLSEDVDRKVQVSATEIKRWLDEREPARGHGRRRLRLLRPLALGRRDQRRAQAPDARPRLPMGAHRLLPPWP